jgi:hypothetical protein
MERPGSDVDGNASHTDFTRRAVAPLRGVKHSVEANGGQLNGTFDRESFVATPDLRFTQRSKFVRVE